MIRLGLRLSLNGGVRPCSASLSPRQPSLWVSASCWLPGRWQRAQRPDRPWCVARHLGTGVPTNSTPDGLWWLPITDQFGSREIDEIQVAAAGPNAPVPPGIPHLPRAGGYYASPALTILLKSEPANQLRDRFPGRQIGTIGGAALPSPNSLIIVIGHTAHQLSHAPGAVEVGAIQRTPANCDACQNIVGSGPDLQFILVGGAVSLLLPVLILIATSSRLSAARREERFAAMRLVGATPHQISVVSAVEAVVAAVAGVAVGFGLFFGFRPLLYHVPFTGAPLAGGDLSSTGRHRARRNRCPTRRRRLRSPGAAQGSDIAARRKSPRLVPPAADRAHHPATGWHRPAGILRLGRQARRRRWPASRAARGLRAPYRGPGSGGAVVHDRGFSTMVKRANRPQRSSPVVGSSTIPRRPSASSVGL